MGLRVIRERGRIIIAFEKFIITFTSTFGLPAKKRPVGG